MKLLGKLAPARAGQEAEGAALRIEPELNLDYPRADIAAIERDEADGGYRITTTFFGLYGVSSPLPGFYTEELLDDEWDELGSRKAFFDIIHNQLYPLLYRAWLKYKFAHNAVEFEHPDYAEIVFSLIGLGADFRRSPARYGHLLRYAGLLSQRVRSLAGLRTILRDRLGEVGIDIRPCVARRVSIARHQRCLLGRQQSTLGGDACIGKAVDDRGGKFHVEIGPLDAWQFAELTGQDEQLAWIGNLLRLYLVQPLEYSITLLLGPGAQQPARLGDPERAVLGRSCWLTSEENRDIASIDLPDSGARC